MKTTINNILGVMLSRVNPDGTQIPSAFDRLAAAQNVPFPTAFSIMQARKVLEPIAKDAWDFRSKAEQENKLQEFEALLASEVEVAVTPISVTACAGVVGLSANDLQALSWILVE